MVDFPLLFVCSPGGKRCFFFAKKIPKEVAIISHKWVSENSVPLNPMVNDHYPYYMAISLGILTQHFQTNPNRRFFRRGANPRLKPCAPMAPRVQVLKLNRCNVELRSNRSWSWKALGKMGISWGYKQESGKKWYKSWDHLENWRISPHLMILDDVTSLRGDGYIMGFLYHEMIQYNGDPTNNLGIMILVGKTHWMLMTKIWKKSRFDVLPIGSMVYIYANIWGILMGSMIPYIAAPWIRHGCWKRSENIS